MLVHTGHTHFYPNAYGYPRPCPTCGHCPTCGQNHHRPVLVPVWQPPVLYPTPVVYGCPTPVIYGSTSSQQAINRLAGRNA